MLYQHVFNEFCFGFFSTSFCFLFACHKLNASTDGPCLPLCSPFHSLQILNELRHTGFWSRPRPIKCHKEHSLTHTHTQQVARMSLSCFGPSQLNPVSCDSLASHLKLCQRLSKWYVPATAINGKGGKAIQESHKENQLRDTFAITFN